MAVDGAQTAVGRSGRHAGRRGTLQTSGRETGPTGTAAVAARVGAARGAATRAWRLCFKAPVAATARKTAGQHDLSCPSTLDSGG